MLPHKDSRIESVDFSVGSTSETIQPATSIDKLITTFSPGGGFKYNFLVTNNPKLVEQGAALTKEVEYRTEDSQAKDILDKFRKEYALQGRGTVYVQMVGSSDNVVIMTADKESKIEQICSEGNCSQMIPGITEVTIKLNSPNNLICVIRNRQGKD